MKIIILVLAALISLSSQQAQPRPQTSVVHEHSEHGFILLGSKQLHLYHLARFHSPHRYQAFAEIKLTYADGVEVDIEKIRRSHRSAKMLSLLSKELFSLPALLTNGRSFKAELFAGYLRDREERKLVASDLIVKIVSVPYFTELANGNLPADSRYKFVTVCDTKTNRIYAAHVIRGSPNFEEVFEIGTIYIPGGYPESNEPSINIGCPGQGVKLEASRGFEDRPLRLKPYDQFSGSIPNGHPGLMIFGWVNEVVLDETSVNQP